MHTVRLVLWILKSTVSTHICEFIVINIDEFANVMNEFMNAIANDSVSKKLIQAVEGSNVDGVEWKIKLSQLSSDFCLR